MIHFKSVLAIPVSIVFLNVLEILIPNGVTQMFLVIRFILLLMEFFPSMPSIVFDQKFWQYHRKADGYKKGEHQMGHFELFSTMFWKTEKENSQDLGCVLLGSTVTGCKGFCVLFGEKLFLAGLVDQLFQPSSNQVDTVEKAFVQLCCVIEDSRLWIWTLHSKWKQKKLKLTNDCCLL